MPAIKAGSKVLVTGASGFIAVHTVEAFLDKGYPVVGTVRSKEKGEYLKDLFKGKKAPFDYVIVEDIAQVRVPPLSTITTLADEPGRRV